MFRITDLCSLDGLYRAVLLTGWYEGSKLTRYLMDIQWNQAIVSDLSYLYQYRNDKISANTNNT